MTHQELMREATKATSRIQPTSAAIANFARSLIPTLKDAGREHSAKELERLMFEYDVAVEEANKLVTDNFKKIFEGGQL